MFIELLMTFKHEFPKHRVANCKTFLKYLFLGLFLSIYDIVNRE